jgi:ABC-type multidrug transport system fused ATPase/permease subunit
VFAAIAVAVYNVIWILILIPFLFLIGFFLVRSLLKALKETARIESVTTSPVLTHLGESILGVSTIRAFKKTEQFQSNHFKLMDKNLMAMIINKAVRSWFNVRLNLIQQFMIICAYTYCVSIIHISAILSIHRYCVKIH